MKMLRLTASVLALAIASPVAAGDDHPCIDDACTMVSLFAQPTKSGSGAAAVQADRMGSWGIDTAGMDKSVKPGDDFFGYVNGTWARNTPIPADRSSFGAFATLRDLSEARTRQLVEGYKIGNPAKDGDQAKVAALYRGFMDEAAIERLDAKPIQPKIAKVRAAKSKDDMARLMGEALGGGFGGSFFGSFVNDDSKNPDYYVLYMGQSGLGLSDRSFISRRSSLRKRRATSNMSRSCSAWPAGRMPSRRLRKSSLSRRRSPMPIGRGPKAATATRPTIR
jgi:putative endopeptidase